MANILTHFFQDVDLRCSHDGLSELIRKEKIKIGEGDFVVFMNTSRTMIKMFCHGKDAILHYKKDGRVLDPGIVKYLPKYCGGTELDIDGAIREHLEELLARRKKQ